MIDLMIVVVHDTNIYSIVLDDDHLISNANVNVIEIVIVIVIRL